MSAPFEEDERFGDANKIWIDFTDAECPIYSDGVQPDDPQLTEWVLASAVAAQVAAARAEGIREAMAVAGRLADEWKASWRAGLKSDTHLEGMADGAFDIAAAIRALLPGGGCAMTEPEIARPDLTPPTSIERLRRKQKRLEMFSAFEAGLLLAEIDRLRAVAAELAKGEKR